MKLCTQLRIKIWMKLQIKLHIKLSIKLRINLRIKFGIKLRMKSHIAFTYKITHDITHQVMREMMLEIMHVIPPYQHSFVHVGQRSAATLKQREGTRAPKPQPFVLWPCAVGQIPTSHPTPPHPMAVLGGREGGWVGGSADRGSKAEMDGVPHATTTCPSTRSRGPHPLQCRGPSCP